MSRRIKTRRFEAGSPGSVNVQYAKSDRHPASPLDHRDQVCVLRIIIGEPIAVVTVTASEKLCEVARAAFSVRRKAQRKLSLLRHFLQMTLIWREFAMRMIQAAENQGRHGDVVGPLTGSAQAT
jgi:hypothetical protein